jgi:hypothetical protein
MSIEKENDNKNLITEISSKSTVHTPEYTIIHSGDFDFSDYTLARVRTKPIGIPRNLIIRISLPTLVNIFVLLF